ncbi:hypothetical protein BC829DRAFT_110897 [Chytridium lagenaria]|nr:hypothetical protein BC829DRAFT_110897 [Chytridium lagenaria]
MRYLPHRLPQYASITLRYQIRCVLEILISSFRSSSMVKGLLEAVMMKQKPELDAQNISETMFLNLKSLHHIGPILVWGADLVMIMLRHVYIFLNTQRTRAESSDLFHLDENGTSTSNSDNFDTLQKPTLVSMLFHTATRKSLIELILVNKLARNNISLLVFILQNKGGKNEKLDALRATAFSLLAPSQALAPDEGLYLLALEQTLSRIKLRLDSVGFFLAEVGMVIDACKPTPAEEEEIFFKSTVPLRFRPTFKPMQAIFSKYLLTFFGHQGEFKHHGNTQVTNSASPIPLGPLAAIVPLFYSLSPDFANLGPIEDVPCLPFDEPFVKARRPS